MGRATSKSWELQGGDEAGRLDRAAVSGPEAVIFTPARDYKLIGEGDTGENTGGMGAVASRQLLEPELMGRIMDEIVNPTIEGLERTGRPDAQRLALRGGRATRPRARRHRGRRAIATLGGMEAGRDWLRVARYARRCVCERCSRLERRAR